MAGLEKAGIVGAVLCFIGLVGMLLSVLLALPPLVIGQDQTTYMNGVYMSLGFGVVAFLGFMIWMLAILLALTKEK